MKKAQTSERLSALAARLMKLRAEDLNGLTAEERRNAAANIRSLAASVLRQDETKGPRQSRGLISRMLGR
jgi:hypothetical protein